MERSLRAQGCTLPLLVIPYSDELFTLPPHASWWKDEKLCAWLDAYGAHPMMRKYQCLLTEAYQFVDTDVIFLQNPEEALSPYSGFVTCCGHWRNTDHAVTEEVLRELHTRYERPHERVFNAGQFASQEQLYSFGELQSLAEKQEYRNTTLLFPFHDQPGMNLLVGIHSTPYTNLTLPPYCLASSWAGDYLRGEAPWWHKEQAPYLMHWAGVPLAGDFSIHTLWRHYLEKHELAGFEAKEKDLAYTPFTSRLKTRVKKFISTLGHPKEGRGSI
jgi:hypothetical protein